MSGILIRSLYLTAVGFMMAGSAEAAYPTKRFSVPSPATLTHARQVQGHPTSGGETQPATVIPSPTEADVEALAARFGARISDVNAEVVTIFSDPDSDAAESERAANAAVTRFVPEIEAYAQTVEAFFAGIGTNEARAGRDEAEAIRLTESFMRESIRSLLTVRAEVDATLDPPAASPPQEGQ